MLAFACAALCGAQPSGSNSIESLLRQAFALHQQARYSEAIPLLEQAHALDPADYFANLLLGIDLLRTGRAQAALPRLQAASRARPSEEIPEGYLGEAQASLQNFAEAAVHYRAAVDRSHASESSLEAWADFALERFRAIGEQLRADGPGIDAARRLHASASAMSACSQPIPSLERALASARTPQSAASVAYALSVCYALQAGDIEARLRNRASDAATLHRLQGDVLLRIKSDPAAAAQQYQAALALAPGDPSLHERLAEAFLAAGRDDEARNEAQAALAIDAHRLSAQRTLVALDMANRDYAAALPLLHQLAAAAPADRSVSVELARALAQTGDPSAALSHLAPALAAGFPDEKGALHALEARLLRQLGRASEADNAAAEARKLSDAFQARAAHAPQANPDVE